MVDVRRLEQALCKETKCEVRFDAGARAAYAYDASNYRQVPIGVLLPRHVDDVVAALALCRAHGVPILARGGGTAQSGQGVNVGVSSTARSICIASWRSMRTRALHA